MSDIKTRFAPSPTGYLHIGGARTALFAWLYAKSMGGECTLRIEDTDKSRSDDKYTQEILNSFNWLDINFDQDVVYQSNNLNRYKEVVDILIEKNCAYICKGEELEEDRKYRNQKLEREENTVVRFKMPDEGSTSFKDIIKGDISVLNTQLDDFIIERSDGSATYNFCVVVDDMDSKITHVIRGDDHVNNTFKQINVFKALSIQEPKYGHVPMILGEDGKRLSKRHGALGVQEYKEMGILPEALKNYLLRLGWSDGDRELFSRDEMLLHFQKGTFNQSPSTFSLDKLLWYNKHYLDESSIEELNRMINLKEFNGSDYSNSVLELIRERCSSLTEFYENSQYFFEDPVDFDETLLKKHIKEDTHDHLELLGSYLAELESWELDSLKNILQQTVDELSIGFGKLGLPLRLALTASVNSPSIDHVCELLGREVTLRRLENFLELTKN